MVLADVAVVGAGPAGSAAAITLARAGRDVVLVDKSTFPRDKCCGDGLTAGALRLLEQLGLPDASVPSWQPVEDVVVRSPSGHEVTFELPRGRGRYAVTARRIELDAALLNQARACGARVIEGNAVRLARQDGDYVVLGLDSGEEVTASYAVAADGMWSPVRKALGLASPGYLGEWHAFRQYFEGVSPRAASELLVSFEADLLPGYFWSFPLPGGRANVGFGIARGGKVEHVQDMKRLWPDLLARPHLRAFLGPDARPEAPHKAWPIPARIDDIRLSAGRVLFVGDAAAATDPMTGEGIAQALLTGILAGESIVRHGPAAFAETATDYEREARRELLADHRMSITLQRALSHRKGARAAVRIAGLSAWTRRNFGRWLFEDEPRAVLFTPHRWHRDFLDRDGAWATNGSSAVPRTVAHRTP